MTFTYVNGNLGCHGVQLVLKDVGPPVINNDGGAATVTTNSATLRGNLLSNGGSPATVSIYWGTNDGGVSSASWASSIPLGVLGEGLFSASVTNLASGTMYYYRCFASNSLGVKWADSTTNFTTGGGFAINGVPIAWLISYYGVTNNYDALALSDTDGDGAAAWEEYVAGTIPTDKQSVLEVVTITRIGSDVEISWPCVNGKIYEVHKSTDLLAPWPGSPVTNNMPADISGTNRLRDVNALNNGAAHYRVEVR